MKVHTSLLCVREFKYAVNRSLIETVCIQEREVGEGEGCLDKILLDNLSIRGPTICRGPEIGLEGKRILFQQS